MKKTKTSIQDSFLIECQKFEDDRGYFMETWNYKKFGLPSFVQDNHSKSYKGVLRGLHYQIKSKSQGKLVRCTQGAVYDVIVDLRLNSPTFGKWYGVELSRPELQIWVPPGMAHGFYTLSRIAEIEYKVTNYYDPSSEIVLNWNDKQLGIVWPIKKYPIISAKDLNHAISFEKCEKYL
tara:strand:- start:349 stop:882 length:534 start_codon:yes stop_codon:yes gene_type:complete